MILVYTFQNLIRAAVARHTVAPVAKRWSPLLLPHLVRPAVRLERLTTLAARMIHKFTICLQTVFYVE